MSGIAVVSTPWSSERIINATREDGWIDGHSVRTLRPAGRSGASIVLAEQGPGDHSDRPAPNLTICRTMNRPFFASVDLGAGRFRARRSSPGDFAVGLPEVATTIVVDDPHIIQKLSVPYLRLLAIAGDSSGLPVDGDFGQLHRRFNRDAQTTDLMDRIWTESSLGSPQGALWADGALLQLAARLLLLRDGPKPRERGGLPAWQVRKVTDYLEENLARDVALCDLARLTGLSTFHFCRSFKQSTGLPPHRWRLARRIERAREMLEVTHLSVTEIAAAVGYDDPSQLSAAFRKALRVSPSEYRRDRR